MFFLLAYLFRRLGEERFHASDCAKGSKPFRLQNKQTKNNGMNKLNFRLLKADEIECRIGTTSTKGVSLLLYKNARVDMALLDEVVGAENWKRSHQVINDNLFCSVYIRISNGEWVEKQDVGTESFTEKEKGQASDAFKRACVNWGIGRELYTAPFVWVNLNENEWSEKNGKKTPRVNLNVSRIEYDEQRRISFLEIRDAKNNIRYSFGNSQEYSKEQEELNDAIAEAVDRVKRTKSREELESVYKSYPHLKSSTKFIEACAQQGKLFKTS